MEFGKVIPDELSNINFILPPDKEETSRILSSQPKNGKTSNSISHIRRLKETSESVDRFLQGIVGFGENLGPVFLIPHPGMGPKTLDTIETTDFSLPCKFNDYR